MKLTVSHISQIQMLLLLTDCKVTHVIFEEL